MTKTVSFFISIMILSSCINKGIKSDMLPSIFSVINEQRVYQLENGDSIDVWPFHLFNIVEFTGVGNGMHESLNFKIIDTIQSCRINDKSQKYLTPEYNLSFSYETIDDSNNEYVSISFHPENKIVKLFKNEKYKILYYYQIEPKIHRSITSTDDFLEGYCIIDIVPLNEKFDKQNAPNYIN